MTREFTEGHIWHKDPFHLTVSREGGLPEFCGRTTYGDNIEDEWFIVFILFELTRRFPDLVIQYCFCIFCCFHGIRWHLTVNLC